MEKPPRLDLAEQCEILQGEVQLLALQVAALRRIQWLLIGVAVVLVLLLGGLGATVHRWSSARPEDMGKVESGVIPIELVQQTVATGSVQFSTPFRRRPLVFVCEAGHAGAFLVCKTDAISETGFTWAAGAGPVRRDYQSELAWFAIEPK